jgi:arylsulfatase A-like enzyme
METKKKKKNILFIYTDQMHRFALNCMGTPDIITPNLDQLAKEGVLFKNAYTNCPICSPFRVNLVTGLYATQTKAFRNQCKIPKSCITLPDVLNKAGYRTSFVGKWHVGDNGNKPIPVKFRGGFTDFIGFQCYNGFYKDVIFYDEENQEHRFNKHRTDVTADIAIERLIKMKDQPFFMCVGFQAPHYPEQPAPEYEAMYKDITIKRRKNIQEIDPYTPTHSPRSPRPRENCPDFKKYGNNLDEYLRQYYALVTQIDANVGRLLKTLDDLGLKDNTIVIFTSDHGDMQGSHGLKNKTLPHEESSGIPLIVRVPEGASGIVTDALVSAVDYFPTCMEYINTSISKNLPGKSFAPLTLGKEQTLDGPIFSEMRKISAKNSWKMIRMKNLKLVVKEKKIIPTMLYDLDADPYELNNLVEDPNYISQINQLRTELLAWDKSTKKMYK